MRATTPVLLALIGLLFAPVSARAATPQVLWSFCAAHFCTDGAHPTAGVLVDKVGDAFGTTAGDLQSDPTGDPHKSTVFGVGPGLNLILGSPYYRFVEFCSAINCTDGAQAASNIIGTVSTTAVTAYGTTVTGGANNAGAIFKATLTTHQAIYSFCSKKDSFSSCADGARPGDIVQDSAGNIYGTTQSGGANAASTGPGVLYKLDTNGQQTVLHDFCSASKCTDGNQPYGRQLALQGKILYGTTYTGGKFNGGVVFRYDTVSKIFDVLYDFCKKPNCTDGQYPQAGVTIDPVTGTLYGATQAGGKGKGVLYAITDPTGTATAAAASFVQLKVFCSAGGICADGTSPGWAPAPDGAGNLIGATYGGGGVGAGLIYELTIVNLTKPTVSYKTLYSFCPGHHCDTGAYPEGSLTLFPAAKPPEKVIRWTSIYGVTIYGGTNNGVPNGGGTVFKLTP
jgi:uncharacterized repeat protein (TIGR03803 family)